VCAIRNQLQGIKVGNWYLFDPEIGSLDKDTAFRLGAYAAHRAVRLPNGTPQPDTHICLSLDRTGLAGLPHLKAVIREAITEGGMTGVLLMCCGDGNDAGEPNHDPGALGYSWLMANFNAIVDFMEAGEDLTPWIVFGPGFDGIIPAWLGPPWNRVGKFIRMARARLNRLKQPGYLALELSFGWWAWTGERNDWATEEGQMVDVGLYEFPITWGPPAAPPASLLLPDGSDWAPSTTGDQRAPWTQVWLVNRFLGDRYRRPASQPRNCEPRPPYADATTPRGRKFFVMWERGTYLWVYFHCDIALVNQQTQVVIDLGAEFY
jgi:hypothetical protein